MELAIWFPGEEIRGGGLVLAIGLKWAQVGKRIRVVIKDERGNIERYMRF